VIEKTRRESKENIGRLPPGAVLLDENGLED
jgi:hypothetical protein